MGILTDYFVASRSELAAIAANGSVPSTVQRVEAPGFHVVPLAKLAKMLATADEGAAPGEPEHHGESFEWFILDVTLAMTERLANLTDTEIEDHGAAIAAIPELGWPAAEGQRVLAGLRDLAKTSIAKNQTLHAYVST